MDWFHLTLRLNLLNQTPNIWVRTLNALNMLTNVSKPCVLMYYFYCLGLPAVNLLSLELTYFCSGLLFAAVVKRRVWDYAFTVTLLHVLITSLGEHKKLLPRHPHKSTQHLFCPCCSYVGVPLGVAVVAGFRWDKPAPHLKTVAFAFLRSAYLMMNIIVVLR